jgi:hypothetical protein
MKDDSTSKKTPSGNRFLATLSRGQFLNAPQRLQQLTFRNRFAAMCRMILRDHIPVDPRQLSLRQFSKQAPSDLERGIDVPVFIPSLSDELILKHVRELEELPVTLR